MRIALEIPRDKTLRAARIVTVWKLYKPLTTDNGDNANLENRLLFVVKRENEIRGDSIGVAVVSASQIRFQLRQTLSDNYYEN